jgi:hypothetical protein
MGIMHCFGAVAPNRINSEDRAYRLAPINPRFLCIKQSQIRDEVLLVIGRNTIAVWRSVFKWRGFEVGHDRRIAVPIAGAQPV